jgi:glucokinase
VYLGIEIGGTKLQLGVGPGDGVLRALWRGPVDVGAGPEGIRRQIVTAVPELLARAGIERAELKSVGVGFGGPVDDATHTVIKSHQIEGWDNFPLADWVADVVRLPAVLGNDADVAGLAEALHGAGKGFSPVFYITIGSGIGGGLIINGEVYRGCGRGAAEIGHLRIAHPALQQVEIRPLEEWSSGWSIPRNIPLVTGGPRNLWVAAPPGGGDPRQTLTRSLARKAEEGDERAQQVLNMAWEALAESICHVIALLCPRRIVIGGGVSLMGEKVLFEPLRRLVSARVFRPFAGLTDIVPAALGEEVVVHGAVALARRRLGEEHP